MKLDLFSERRERGDFFEVNIWIYNGKGDPLALEYFTTKTEAISFIKKFKKAYKGTLKLDCYVNHFDEDNYVDYSIDV